MSSDHDGSSGDRGTRRRWYWTWGFGVLGVHTLCLVIWVVPAYRISGRMDSVTGSSISERVWTFGFTTGPRKETSALETWLTERRIEWTPNWTFMYDTGCNLLGRGYSFRCGRAPPIHGIESVLPELIDTLSEEELREFVSVMKSGTEEEQDRAVDKALERLLNR